MHVQASKMRNDTERNLTDFCHKKVCKKDQEFDKKHWISIIA